MALKTLLLIAIILQLIAVVTAIKLTRVTKYNISWMLFTVAFIALCVVRLTEFIPLVGGKEWQLPPHFFAWMGIITSLCFAIGVFYVSKIFKWIQQLNYNRKIIERRILTTVLRTEEKERMRFSKDLHDGLGPLLSSAKMSLSQLAKTDHTPEDAELIKNTNFVIEEAIRSLREISNNLSPHTLNSFGLARAVSAFIKTILSNAPKTLDILFKTNLKTERFDTNVEVIIYRVVCELINNSLKHSGAERIDLIMLHNDGNITIHYSDNGRGFDPESVMEIGMGLPNITSRIHSLKGDIDIKSSRNNGMSVDIKINVIQVNERQQEI